MSMFGDILDRIVALLEGTAGTDRTIDEGTFRHYDSLSSFLLANAERNPRPFYIDVQDGTEPAVPSDVAGQYQYMVQTIDLFVNYVPLSHAAYTLDKTIDDDRASIVRCLLYPINYINGWCNTTITTTRQTITNDEGSVVHAILVLSLELFYREDFS